MKSFLLKGLKNFLSLHYKGKGPLLMGFSGGEDSSALFSLLLELKKELSFDLHVAHFDHAWREESREEACVLQNYVEGNSLAFHMQRSNSQATSNLEDEARIERFRFFGCVYQRIQAEALLLAHQKGDQVETVLKRIFEGAGILSLGGMQECSFYEGMQVWRPLLGVERKDLEDWNGGVQWKPFQDRTNEDLKFLRPRMRESLLPSLETQFGKGIRSNLFKLGAEISLLRNYFYKKWDPFLSQIKEGVLGCSFFVSDLSIEDAFEKQEVIRLFLQKRKVTLSSSSLKKVLELLDQNASNKEVDVSDGFLFIERGVLIWLRNRPPSFQGTVLIEQGDYTIRQGSVSWKVEEGKKPFQVGEDSLLFCFLQGKVPFKFNKGFSFSSYENLSEKEQKKVSGYLAKHKVPAKLKRMFPFVVDNLGFVQFYISFNCDVNYENSVYLSSIILKI